MIKDMIVSLSKKYRVLSSLTSYVAVETRKEKDKAKGEIVLRKVPVMVTMGWHGLGSATDILTEILSLQDAEGSFASTALAPGRCGRR